MRKLSIYQIYCLLGLMMWSTDGYGRTIEVAALATGLEVVQYIPDRDGRSLAVIAGGLAQGITTGDLFETFRVQGPQVASLGNDSLKVQTGTLKALEVHQTTTLAAVIDDGTSLSRRLLPRFTGVMAGDIALAVRPQLIANHALTPTITFTYDELFIDAKAMPATFELSPAGRETLREIAAVFGTQKLSKLLVEGHTDRHGPSRANQVESYQRAMTVRQFLISEIGLEPERTVAIGFGQSEPLDDDRVPGYRSQHRRIVLKAITF